MSDDILNTIEVLTNKVRGKEEEANKLKKLVNELCLETGVAIRYPHISESGISISSIRSDQFYGQTLTAAVRSYLDIRKSADLGAASVADIFRAITDGGYKFNTRDEENAKTTLRLALRKSSSVFHRLPNGQYGLLAWYPSAKPQLNGETDSKTKKGKKAQTQRKEFERTKSPSGADLVTNKEIRDAILSQQGEFRASDIETVIKEKYPSKELPKTKTPSVLFLLKSKGFVRMVSPRSGKTGALFSKA